MEPSLYKDARTKRGFTYHYLCVYAQQSKPTLLFLHGFPSTSYDWRHQIEYFKPKGYGLIVPDLLGYGGTDKPLEIKEFRMTAMAEDINDLLDKEGLGCVIGVGHDWFAV
jgi:soluble epoxide hydrolase/lipid-phosphate phosphatase